MHGNTYKGQKPKTDHAALITARIVELIEAGEVLPWPSLLQASEFMRH